MRLAAPGSLVEKQSIEFFFGLPIGGHSAHPVSKHTPAQLDFHLEMLGLQPAPLFTKDLFGNLLCESSPVVKVAIGSFVTT